MNSVIRKRWFWYVGAFTATAVIGVSSPLAAQTSAASASAPLGSQTVLLNFRDVEIAEVASAFSQSMGVAILLDPRVKGKVTLESPNALPIAKAYALFVSALSLQGFSVIESDSAIKVLPSVDAKTVGGRVNAERPGAGIITRVFVLKHESANQVINAVRGLVPAANPVTSMPQTNSIVVTDTAENIARLERVITSLDVPQARIVEAYVSKHLLPSDLAFMIDRIVNEPLQRTGQSADLAYQRITFLPSTRNNTLYIRGVDPDRIAFALNLARQFDVPSQTPANIHVVYLKNAEARHLATVLQSVFKTSAPSTDASVGSSRSRSEPMPPPTRPTGSPGLSSTMESGSTPTTAQTAVEVMLADGVLIRSEPTLNALIVVAPEPMYREIRAVIDQLDVRRAQVYIESLIVEVSSDRAAEFGVQFQYLDGLTTSSTRGFGGSNFGPRGSGVNLLDLATNPTAAGAGLNIGVIRGTINYNGATIANLGALARALESRGNTNVIATPNLLTLDNEESRIIIGQNVPFLTGSYTTGTNPNPFQTIERKDVGTTLRVRPMVTEGGSIRLQIFQEVSSVSTDRSLAATSGLITNRRAIESTVLVDDEQIIVLGGLIEDREVSEEVKVPLLGNIPVLGALFRYNNRSRIKSNLLVFLRPVILRSAQDSSILTNNRYDIIRRAQRGELLQTPITLPEIGSPEMQENPLPRIKPLSNSSK
jgi:general secretion pathway protein D